MSKDHTVWSYDFIEYSGKKISHMEFIWASAMASIEDQLRTPIQKSDFGERVYRIEKRQLK